MVDYSKENNIEIFDLLIQLMNGEIIIRNTEGITERFKLFFDRQIELDMMNYDEQLEFIFPKDNPNLSFVHNFLDQSCQSLEDVYKKISDVIIRPEIPTDVDFIRIMTIHKSKGLTAKHVFVIGCIQGLTPKYPRESLSFLEESRFFEEQRRLFYVAITRATQSLYITSSIAVPHRFARKYGIVRRGNKDSECCYTMSSTFLDELGPLKEDFMQAEDIFT